jgi:hypothetical protein
LDYRHHEVRAFSARVFQDASETVEHHRAFASIHCELKLKKRSNKRVQGQFSRLVLFKQQHKRFSKRRREREEDQEIDPSASLPVERNPPERDAMLNVPSYMALDTAVAPIPTNAPILANAPNACAATCAELDAIFRYKSGAFLNRAARVRHFLVTCFPNVSSQFSFA